MTEPIRIFIKNIKDEELKRLEGVVHGYFETLPVFVTDSEQNAVAILDYADFQKPLRLGGFIDKVTRFIVDAGRSRPEFYDIAGFRLDLAHRELIDNQDAVVKLTDKEFDILVFLYESKGEVEKQDLLSHVWGFVEGLETHTLETHIYRLRQKLESDPASPNVLVTNDKGYLLQV